MKDAKIKKWEVDTQVSEWDLKWMKELGEGACIRGTEKLGPCTWKVNKREATQRGMMALSTTSPRLTHSCEILAGFIRAARNQSENFRTLYWGKENSWIYEIEGYFKSHLQCYICTHRKNTRK